MIYTRDNCFTHATFRWSLPLRVLRYHATMPSADRVRMRLWITDREPAYAKNDDRFNPLLSPSRQPILEHGTDRNSNSNL